jgi:hypothetical protein
MRVRGEVESAARIALQRKEAEKKELRPLRLERLWCVKAGVGKELSTIEQLVMSLAGGSVTWLEQRVAW